MLQTLQLRDVARRYASEVAELRTFLEKAGVPLETPQAVEIVSSRLQKDRAFHRDLALYAWAAMERSGVQIDNAELLGMIALAAAGIEHAARMGEEEAHALLRFVIEARRSTGLTATAESLVEFGSRLPAADVGPMLAPEAARSAERHVRPIQQEAQNGRGSQKHRAWAAGALCLLIILFGGRWLRHRQPATVVSISATHDLDKETRSRPVSPASAPPASAVINNPVAGEARPVSPAVEAKAVAHRGIAGNFSAKVKSWFTRAAPLPLRTAPYSAGTEGKTNDLESAVASAPSPLNAPTAVGPGASAVLPASRAGSTSNPLAISGPVATFGRPVVTPTINFRAAPVSNEDLGQSASPHLLRRHPTTPFLEYEELREGVRAGGSGSGGMPQGIVRQASLGTMAENVVYSPAPAYPVAAAAAHVQGEVKIEAEVDRQGNVASARVISGPPLLRDAALDAVQRWRFKPYVAGGKAVAMGATAVLEFELP